MPEDQFAELRRLMLAEIAAEAVFASGEIGKAALDPRVLEAMGRVPRHEFVPAELRPYAYANSPLPIGCDKTISQPFICALMTDLLELAPDDRVLEIGTGLGYQAAVLAGLVATVYSVEVVEPLAAQAKKRLAGYGNVVLRTGNGYYGWPEHAPFDKVIVTAAPDLVPPPLLGQLKAGGKMVIPAGLPDAQRLMLVEKSAEGRATMKEILRVRFSLLEGGESAGG
jgi:protein-L-isoaspartate(D-aspartate) O-methyltransferase